LPRAAHLRAPFDDDEQCVGGRSLGEDGIPVGQLDTLGLVRDVAKSAAPDMRESFSASRYASGSNVSSLGTSPGS